mmetsp:Transcript_6542/g.6100  ORF Transcript_6542/g.6100 Transcript_6542/m.6100 type:complete len:190 (-) Transcript_6542:13-582(-)
MEQNRDIADVNGDARITFLKTQFKNIIQNALAFNALATLRTFDTFKYSEWLKLREELAKPKPDFSGIKVPASFKGGSLSSQGLQLFRDHGEAIINTLREIRTLVQSLVKTRNKMFMKYGELIKIYENSDYKYDKNDHISIRQKWEEYKKKGIDLFTIFKIDKRDPNKDYSSDVELTEWEEDEELLEFRS